MADKLRQAAEMALSALEKAVSTTEDAAIRQTRCIYHLRQALVEPPNSATDFVESESKRLQELAATTFRMEAEIERLQEKLTKISNEWVEITRG